MVKLDTGSSDGFGSGSERIGELVEAPPPTRPASPHAFTFVSPEVLVAGTDQPRRISSRLSKPSRRNGSPKGYVFQSPKDLLATVTSSVASQRDKAPTSSKKSGAIKTTASASKSSVQKRNARGRFAKEASSSRAASGKTPRAPRRDSGDSGVVVTSNEHSPLSGYLSNLDLEVPVLDVLNYVKEEPVGGNHYEEFVDREHKEEPVWQPEEVQQGQTAPKSDIINSRIVNAQLHGVIISNCHIEKCNIFGCQVFGSLKMNR